MRKRDRRAGTPSLLLDPRGWLEETSGSGALQYRADVRLGVDMHDADKGIRVINGVRKGEEMHPLFIRQVETAGFDQAAEDEIAIEDVLTRQQLKHWDKLPETFRFEAIADGVVPRSSLSRLLERAEVAGFVRKSEQSDAWLKVA